MSTYKRCTVNYGCLKSEVYEDGLLLSNMSYLEAIPTIPEFYQGRKIFITGGTGFMGKVLVEKLLRSCPDLDTIYLLIRPKKGKDPSSRLKDITKQALFDRVKQEHPSSLEKLVAVSGDVKELGLGLSHEDCQKLQKEVSIVFHLAASVRFDDPIRDAILINVRGTLQVLTLALGMEHLKVILHLSTAYANCDQLDVVEKMFPPPGDWRTIIQIVEQEKDEHLLNCITPKILGTLPNTYTYAKALSEHVVKDYHHLLPLVIVRPSIVMWSATEPSPGWIDNLNGPIALMLAGAVGLISCTYGDPNHIPDYIPVDIAINSIIVLAWDRATSRDNVKLPLYNCTSMVVPTTLQDGSDICTRVAEKDPLDNILWYPKLSVTFNWANYYLMTIFLHLLPATILDGLLKLLNKKPMFAKLIRRAFIANKVLSIFCTRNYSFDNTKFLQREASMIPSDLAAFKYNKMVGDYFKYMNDGLNGTRVHILKDSLSSLPHARRHFQRMYWLDRAVKLAVIVIFLWILSSFIYSCSPHDVSGQKSDFNL